VNLSIMKSNLWDSIDQLNYGINSNKDTTKVFPCIWWCVMQLWYVRNCLQDKGWAMFLMNP